MHQLELTQYFSEPQNQLRKTEEHTVRTMYYSLKLSVTLYTIHKPVLLHLTSPSYLIVTLVFVSDCKLCVYSIKYIETLYLITLNMYSLYNL